MPAFTAHVEVTHLPGIADPAGATVERIVAVIDRLEGARENLERAGLVFESLFTVRDLGIES